MLPKSRRFALLAGAVLAAVATTAAAVPAASVPQSTSDSQYIRLAGRTFDPLASAALAAPTGKSGYLVQFRGPVTDDQRAALRRVGVRLGAYIPDYAYVVRSADPDRLRALDFVRWVGDYAAADKVDAPLALAGTRARYLVTVVDEDVREQSAVARQVSRIGGRLDGISESKRHVLATLTPAQVSQVAALPDVLSVGAVSEPQTDMDMAREATGANHIESVGGYKGTGVRGEVMDGGVRSTHQEFRAHPLVFHGSNSTSTSHGTATTGQIFASGVSSTRRGLLPDGQGIFATYNKPDRYAHTKELVNPAGPYRAVFQSNSWGDTLTTSYNSISAAFDDIIFDHDILICQSQSNAGTRQSRPQAWSKNVLSVGGQYHYNTLSRTDDKWNSGASIGPAADGRIKPDVSNYYDQINTTSSSSDTSYTASFGGTSGATPITCGNAGLLFQLWADGVLDGGPGKNRDVFTSRPHAATAKALLINTASQYPFTGTTSDMTRTHQGWGSVNVRTLYDSAKAGGWKLPILVNETDLLTTGQTKRYTITTNGTKPLLATLVYADPMGSPSASVATVNDLTLKVISPTGTVYYGNNGLSAGVWSTSGGSANRVDTVENVFVQSPGSGTWTVDVIATAVNQDGHVETSATDADFALVVR
ncbi:Flagellar hook-length control protein FliK [Alloactinosynnema sp. L-07]|uniref:S8 family serine peptidase n=1 Tax=Alloactinosynnema sp. L-07 TaxID=1653480 RepID=UPI00065F0A80|nr:S8 family serine peptidase [Alloactinosynnema sp. L-07]CRK58820.1 Flagellar hook-length control protein FliK [Alloactinosynnema sp. L-07]